MSKNFYLKQKNWNKKIYLPNNLHTRTDLIDSFGKHYQINENDQTFGWLMINEVDPYLVFLKVCETIDKCSVVKNNKGFDITIDNIENAILVEDMKKWGLHRRVNEW